MDIKFLVESLFSLIAITSSLIIFLRTKKVYELSYHKGIRCFRNAFFFYLLAFTARYLNILTARYLSVGLSSSLSILLDLFFTYSLSIAGFYLVYSLIWKDHTGRKEYLLHIAALLISVIGFVYNQGFIFISQLAIFSYAITLGYSNYIAAKSKKKDNFLQFYLIGLILGFIGYLINLISWYLSSKYPSLNYYSYAITASVFLIFLYGVVNVLKWERKGKD